MKRHRSRRQRRQRRNVIGFSQSLLSQDSSEEDESDLDEGEMQSLEPSFDAMTHGAESSLDSLDKMSSDLDGLVRFIRRGVESLAGGTGNAAPAFGVLAFALEDWDL
jgi:gamma-tubulin complex component 5